MIRSPRLFFLVTLLLVVLACANAALATPVAVVLSVEPTTSTAVSVQPTLTWSAPGAASCTASDGWTGAKAAAGTEKLAAITQTTKFTLKCASTRGPLTFSWTPPTQNSDGSPLTDLAGYEIQYGEKTPYPHLVTITNPGLVRHVEDALAGKREFVMRAVRKDGIKSQFTTPPFVFTVMPDTGQVEVTTTITKAAATTPAKPTNFSVSQAP